MLYVCIAAHLGARHARADPANACHQRCFVQSVSTNVRFQIGIFSRTKLEVNCRVADFIVKPRTWTLQSGYHKMFRYIKHFWAIFSQDWPISNLQKIRSSQGWRQSSAKDRCKGRIPLHVSYYAILLLWYGYFVLSIYAFIFAEKSYHVTWGNMYHACNVAGVELPVPDYGKLEEVIRQVLDEMGCQKVQHSVDKCISIYETRINGYWYKWHFKVSGFVVLTCLKNIFVTWFICVCYLFVVLHFWSQEMELPEILSVFH